MTEAQEEKLIKRGYDIRKALECMTRAAYVSQSAIELLAAAAEEELEPEISMGAARHLIRRAISELAEAIEGTLSEPMRNVIDKLLEVADNAEDEAE